LDSAKLEIKLVIHCQETIVHEPGLCSRSSGTNFTDLDGGALFNKNIDELFTDPQLQ